MEPHSMFAVLGLAPAALEKWWSQRSATPPTGNSRNDRYAAEEMISQAQSKLYQYLLEVFPGYVVLFAQPLSRLVSVRSSDNRQRALERLQPLQVDFVVCGADGKPFVAFQVDAWGPDDVEAARRRAAAQQRVLATAGVQLLRLKKSVHELPPSDEFRKRVDAMLVNDEHARQTNSESMTLSDLMGLPQAPRE